MFPLSLSLSLSLSHHHGEAFTVESCSDKMGLIAFQRSIILLPDDKILDGSKMEKNADAILKCI